MNSQLLSVPLGQQYKRAIRDALLEGREEVCRGEGGRGEVEGARGRGGERGMGEGKGEGEGEGGSERGEGGSAYVARLNFKTGLFAY